MTTPRRSWFAFSLGTMFVGVTLAACAVVWVQDSLNWASQRERFFSAGHAMEIDGAFPPRPLPHVPWGLRLIGERGRRIVWVNDPAILYEARRLFPESEVRYHDFQF